ncbi:general secretion pathway protein GspB [Agarivorans albus]|uniref:General secretion pathway protein B n=1 Tax=Agarivorans albus MKT 106 TaxID=1331007 RepID=R9PKY0_AGAAL|nr:general secretion pathway protein GspB [Agarivorans albus]GAD01903.1 general secretion pathway protein B [Agarivorans albus MKT 106]
MSSILDAQRRSQPNEAVALVAPSPVNPVLTAVLSSVLTLSLGAGGFWLWQQSNKDTAPANVEAAVQPVTKELETKPIMRVSRVVEPKLEIELLPLPQLEGLEKVDLLALRQKQFETLLNAPIPQYQAPEPLATPNARSTVLASEPAPVQQSAPAKPSSAEEKGLEQRFAAAVQATNTLSWDAELDPSTYDNAPMVGALDPEVQKLVPAITFNSHVFSSDPNRRYVTLNDKELVEGDFVTKNIELVAIRLDDIVLRVAGNLCRLNALSDWG